MNNVLIDLRYGHYLILNVPHEIDSEGDELMKNKDNTRIRAIYDYMVEHSIHTYDWNDEIE